MQVKVLKAEMTERTVNRKRDGKSFTFREQSAQVSLQNGEVRNVALSLDEGQAPYAPGVYSILDTSFYVDRNNKLALGRLHLAPVSAVAETSRRQAG